MPLAVFRFKRIVGLIAYRSEGKQHITLALFRGATKR
jgi:hypothetical protein